MSKETVVNIFEYDGHEEEVSDKIDKLTKNYKEQIDNLLELKRSLNIKKVCPTAFDHGSCKVFMTNSAVRDEWESLTVIKGDGSKIVLTDRTNFPRELMEETLTKTEKTRMSRKRSHERYKKLKDLRL